MANSEFVFPFGSGGISPVNPSLFPDGLVTAPAVSWINEPTSGRYRIGAGNIGESILGVKKLDWNATRFLTTIPIQVSDGTQALPGLGFASAATGWYLSSGDLKFSLGNATKLSFSGSVFDILDNNAAFRWGVSSDTDFTRVAARVIRCGPTTGVRLNWSTDGLLVIQNFAGSAFGVIQGIHRTTANAVAETPTPTHTITLQDASGTLYRVPCLV